MAGVSLPILPMISLSAANESMKHVCTDVCTANGNCLKISIFIIRNISLLQITSGVFVEIAYINMWNTKSTAPKRSDQCGFLHAGPIKQKGVFISFIFFSLVLLQDKKDTQCYHSS